MYVCLYAPHMNEGGGHKPNESRSPHLPPALPVLPPSPPNGHTGALGRERKRHWWGERGDVWMSATAAWSTSVRYKEVFLTLRSEACQLSTFGELHES